MNGPATVSALRASIAAIEALETRTDYARGMADGMQVAVALLTDQINGSVIPTGWTEDPDAVMDRNIQAQRAQATESAGLRVNGR